MSDKQKTSDIIAAVHVAAEALAKQDRRVEAAEVEDATKAAYDSAKRNQ